MGNALRAVHVRVKFFLRHRFPWKFPETVFFRASQISERISGNLDEPTCWLKRRVASHSSWLVLHAISRLTAPLT